MIAINILSSYSVIGFILAVGIIWGIKLMSSPKTAVKGNMIGAFSMLGAVILTLVYHDIIGNTLLWIALAIGGIIGYFLASRVAMIQMPQMVAILNGFGGAASALVASIMLFSNFSQLTVASKFTSGLALMVGSITFSGSLIAAAKLDQRMEQKPVVLKGHSFLNIASLLAVIVSIFLITFNQSAQAGANLYIFIILALSLFFGYIFAIRVGGADMPITISLLNSMSGLAASIAGFAIYNTVLVVIGAVVGASGLILTQIMCRAMNRSLFEVLAGNTNKSDKKVKEEFVEKVEEEKTVKVETEPEEKSKIESKTEMEETEKIETNEGKKETVASKIEEAESVIIVPGYGMALAQAQSKVKELHDKLEDEGKEVNFAIHPVAGRMPGHMNVLLAEVDIAYDKLLEIDTANPKFPETDVVLVVGANDVINPAAKTAEGTPIYGMPILNVDEAENLVIMNLDKKPGYAGVDNSLYEEEKTDMVLGDAKESLTKLLSDLNKVKSSSEAKSVESTTETVKKENNPAAKLKEAESVIIVPGYGMALAQAQSKVKELHDKLEDEGKEVNFAIHPVAGRMPGHMNVLLAEVDIAYDKLLEIDTANPKFPETDVVLVVGANDVINPAAKTAEGTPIYGMPILNVEEAENLVIMNLDKKPGYAGVDNSLYEEEKTDMVLGDAKESLNKLIMELE